MQQSWSTASYWHLIVSFGKQWLHVPPRFFKMIEMARCQCVIQIFSFIHTAPCYQAFTVVASNNKNLQPQNHWGWKGPLESSSPASSSFLSNDSKHLDSLGRNRWVCAYTYIDACILWLIFRCGWQTTRLCLCRGMVYTVWQTALHRTLHFSW